MNKNLEWLVIISLVVLLVVLSACAEPRAGTQTKQPEVPEVPDEQPDSNTPTVANMEGIANVLGCMFDPTPCQEKKDLGKTEEGKQ